MDFEQLEADFASHPIEGYLHTGERLHVPLISHIVDNLYVGGCMNGVDVGDFFSDIFSFYKWEKYRSDDATLYHEWTMYDSREHPIDVDAIADALPRIVYALNQGGNVLVHCQAGINRSNLMAAHVLHDWKGMTYGEAISLLRERRSPLVLSNGLFAEYLKGLDEQASVV
jgi:protein-tyrosine phosphatase